MSISLNGLWGSSKTDVFVVGGNVFFPCVILHYDGSAWTEMESESAENPKGVWGSSGTDVFTVGYNGTILHYDGSVWSPMESGTTEHLNGVWGSSGTDVFTVGYNGTILHYDGSVWSPMDGGTAKWLNGVWGSSMTDVFVVGSIGTILHYDGSTWSDMGQDTKDEYNSVWGSSGTDVFVSGNYGSILNYNGSAWSFMRPEGSDDNAVVDMEFHNQNSNVLYAASFGAGVYLSPNQTEEWLNLGAPEHLVFAISTGSLYAATEGGLLQCTGTGVIAGRVTDQTTGIGIDNATVITDFGVTCRSIDGDYMMVSPSGIFDVTTIADGHANTTIANVVVLGGDVTWPPDAAMPLGDPDWSVVGGGGTGKGGGGGGCFIATAAVDLIWPNRLRLLVHSQMISFCDMRSAKVWLPDIAGRKNPSECTWIPIHGQKAQQGVLNLGKSSPAGVVTGKWLCPEKVPGKTVK